MSRHPFSTLPVALIDRIKAAVAGIAHIQTPAAMATKQQALQQTKSLSGRSSEDLAVGAVRCQPFAVREELIPGDVTWMVIRNDDKPLILWHEARLTLDLAGGSDLLTRLVSQIRRCQCRMGWPGCR